MKTVALRSTLQSAQKHKITSTESTTDEMQRILKSYEQMHRSSSATATISSLIQRRIYVTKNVEPNGKATKCTNTHTNQTEQANNKRKENQTATQQKQQQKRNHKRKCVFSPHYSANDVVYYVRVASTHQRQLT